MPEVAQVAALDEFGCRVVGIANGPVGSVMQILPGPGGTPLPGFGPAPGGGPVTVALRFADGVLDVTVNGVMGQVSLRGSLAQDLAGRPLGYWLPVS